MRNLEQWLNAYAESHTHKTNRKIHKVAVPGIYLSIVGLIWSIPPLVIGTISINWVWLALFPVLMFYSVLSRSVLFQMALFSFACLAIITFMARMQWPVLTISIALFVVLWVCQFIGHKIEGKKPSFFEDILFLLIGPIWVFRQK
ncbi:DUF962 domain-containing protein [Vibrio sp. ZSDZ34]|uniref:DUF962 domain-containing protein n=1 Tax=Vibrio gelatinilyticus TaxID=2893468 RepID=A0A9X2AZM4_9VIBR|nr:Mpo1-like protein [Vibrio gelatinilyticus]MCJ2377683.1 DUF962 domain-containing protein [Vibrio gelatinilyticus]